MHFLFIFHQFNALSEPKPQQQTDTDSVPKKFQRVGTSVPAQWNKSTNALKLQYHCGGIFMLPYHKINRNEDKYLALRSSISDNPNSES
ncbi:MAG: hypothetical protein IKG96_01960 [Bacteroidaceae bacterium]|nr:hypothetical protein [Bacteroidaceae bacterium]